MRNQHFLIKVATEQGHVAFWLDELLQLEDLGTGGAAVVLAPVANNDLRRTIRSVWTVERILKIIEEGDTTRTQKVVYDEKSGCWRDIVTGVKVAV